MTQDNSWKQKNGFKCRRNRLEWCFNNFGNIQTQTKHILWHTQTWGNVQLKSQAVPLLIADDWQVTETCQAGRPEQEVIHFLFALKKNQMNNVD